MSLEHPHNHEEHFARHEEREQHLSRQAQAHFEHCSRNAHHESTAHQHLPGLTIDHGHAHSGQEKMTPQKREDEKQWQINKKHGED